MKKYLKSLFMIFMVTCVVLSSCAKTQTKEESSAKQNSQELNENQEKEMPVARVRDTSVNPASDFKYDLYGDSEIILRGYIGSRLDIVVPDEIEGFPVVALGNYFAKGSSILTVTLPETIREIGKEAFYASNLEEIAIPSAIEKIGWQAFEFSKLKKIKLTKALIDAMIKDRSDSMFRCTFNDCRNLTEVEIAEDVTIIPEGFFTNCYGLQHIKLPSSLKAIGDYAFSSSGLIDIDFPSETKQIEGLLGATMSCLHLSAKTQLAVRKLDPAADTSDFEEVFSRTKGGRELNIPQGLTVADFEKYDTGTVEYTYSYRLNEAGNGVCILGYLGTETDLQVPEQLDGIPVIYVSLSVWGNRKLTSVTLPDTVTEIGPMCFYDQTGLKKVTLPKNLEKINDGDNMYGAFANSGITEIVIPASVKKLGISTFRECKNLEKVIFEEGFQPEIIEANCFAGCSKLANIVLPDSIKVIRSCAFSGCKGNEILQLPSNIVIIYGGAFGGWKDLKDLIIPDTVEHIILTHSYSNYSSSVEDEYFAGTLTDAADYYDFMDAFDYSAVENWPLKTKARLVKMGARK